MTDNCPSLKYSLGAARYQSQFEAKNLFCVGLADRNSKFGFLAGSGIHLLAHKEIQITSVMPRIISKSNELRFEVSASDIHGIDNKEFFDFGHQIRKILHLDFVGGLATQDQLSRPRPYKRMEMLRLFPGTIRSLKNQWHLLDRKYRVRINGGPWGTGHIIGKVNDQLGYMLHCRGSGVCTLTITSIGTEGLGFNHSIHDLRPHQSFDFQNLHIDIKSKPAANKILQTLISIGEFLEGESEDEFLFYPK
ncbi:hypothetical protein GC207_09760 [bacterium]|nr:hypothetical protein [bacterium]